MKNTPTCDKCGQSDEFFVSEDNIYICICGHQCTGPDQRDALRPVTQYYLNQKKSARIH
ncbi:hypothetical protein MD588_20815 [Photobacterium sp. SDRW27]|uniref:hypothetical protein n=1 Tax=Photobacterium obscurum TaxID=2829490 RepID=UPI002243EE39|nr:hypothetical protein [Photobacterium obscurum]MCW8331239.1 hypothetical protein [Photobacterium obscurum]